MSISKSLRTLAAVAPGSGFVTMLEIAALEKQLGLPHGRPTFNAVRAQARLADLQAQVAAKSAPAPSPAPSPAPASPAPTPTVPAPVAPAPAPAPATVPALSGLARTAASFKSSAADAAQLAVVPAPAPVAPGSMPTERIAALAAHVFGRQVTHTDDPQARQKCLAKLHTAGVAIPGETNPHPTEITGLARMLHGVYQNRANEFLSNNK